MTVEIGKRIIIIGVTGSGKTTLAHELGARLGHKHIELDSLYWELSWKEAPTEVFLNRVAAALDHVDYWVVDGNYRETRPITWVRADTLIWMDYPLHIIFLRLLRRSFKRVFTREELWNGNRESFREQFLSRNSLFVWAWRSYKKHHREYPQQLQKLEYVHLRVFRLRSPRETENFLISL
jgi:adenylate kinase family enzyme